jgi:hypothetical protein
MQKILQTFNQVIKNFYFLIMRTIFAAFEKLIARFSLVANPLFLLISNLTG